MMNTRNVATIIQRLFVVNISGLTAGASAAASAAAGATSCAQAAPRPAANQIPSAVNPMPTDFIRFAPPRFPAASFSCAADIPVCVLNGATSVPTPTQKR